MAAPHELVAVTAFGDAILHAFSVVVHPFVLLPCGFVDLPPSVVVADLI